LKPGIPEKTSKKARDFCLVPIIMESHGSSTEHWQSQSGHAHKWDAQVHIYQFLKKGSHQKQKTSGF
jgi:hypothetical protein